VSSFLSNKYLEYRKRSLEPPKPIDADLHCSTCGYNIRGLTVGRNCPECGTQITRDIGSADVLLDGSESDRQRTKWGLTLLAFALIGTPIKCLGGFIWLVFFPSSANTFVLAGFDLAFALAWAAGTWLLLSKRLDAHNPNWRVPRLIARWTQMFFPISLGLWLLAATQSANVGASSTLLKLELALTILGYLGAIGLVLTLHRLACGAELDTSARRINLAMWMLSIPSLILMTIPDQVFWVSLLLIGPVVLVWCWFVLMLGRGVLTMQRHVSWSLRLAQDAPLRSQRVADTRRELDAAVRAQIRTTPGPLDEVPLDREEH